MRPLFILLPLALLSCASVPAPQEALARANREFAGKDVGEFFVDYGSATGSRTLSNGDKSYRWVSLESSGLQDPAAIITYPGGHFGQVGNNGETISGYCEIRILTDGDDRIKNLTLVYDSIGRFSGSRCAEIFSQNPS